jgi:hypothetical protein
MASDSLFDEEFETMVRERWRLRGPDASFLVERFEAIGQQFRKMILSTPTAFRLGPPDIHPTQWIEWISDEVRSPVDRLLNALGDRTKLSALPDVLPHQLTDHEVDELGRLLRKLRDYAENLDGCLQSRRRDRSTVNAELRAELVWRLAEACEGAGIAVARNHYAGTGDAGVATALIEQACIVICGEKFSVDHHLRDYLKLRLAKNR